MSIIPVFANFVMQYEVLVRVKAKTYRNLTKTGKLVSLFINLLL